MKDLIVKFEKTEAGDIVADLNGDNVRFYHNDFLLFDLRFDEVQVIYKAMCDKRFKTLENEM